ncbi:MAG: hypothetical protein GF398_17560 [Chitinivibrionales bacterium]|nr:hypothetical protein [Chitinivibrionales bacterium]
MIIRSGWVARLILVLLSFLSVIVIAVILNRLLFLRSIQKLNKKFRSSYATIGNLVDLEQIDSKFGHSPLSRIGRASAGEYKRIISDAKAHTNVKDWSFYLQNQFAIASEHLESLLISLCARLDHGLFLLAIISSVAPFIGLLGTVWGIMNSFFEIGNQGSASLPVVAPGIAEALITTIIGLAVAIPSVFFYNYLNHRAERIEDELYDFKELLFARMKRELFSLLYGGSTAGPAA